MRFGATASPCRRGRGWGSSGEGVDWRAGSCISPSPPALSPQAGRGGSARLCERNTELAQTSSARCEFRGPQNCRNYLIVIPFEFEGIYLDISIYRVLRQENSQEQPAKQPASGCYFAVDGR